MSGQYKFIHIHDGVRVEVELDGSYIVTLDQVMREFRAFLIAMGFHPDNVEEYIDET